MSIATELLNAVDWLIAELQGGGPPQPPPNDRTVVTALADGFEVGLVDRPHLYSPYVTDCSAASHDGVDQWFAFMKKAKLGKHPGAAQRTIYKTKGRLPGLRTYEGTGPESDVPSKGVQWSSLRLAESLGYLRRTIDGGRPVMIGVAELDHVMYKKPDPAKPGVKVRANDGVTDHYLLISGYRVRNGLVTELHAVDNATAESATPPETDAESYPIFNVVDDTVVKPGASYDDVDRAVEMRYDLTMVRVYTSDVPAAKKLTAWHD